MPDWPRKVLGDLVVNHDARRVPVRETDRRAGPYPYYGASGIVDSVDRFIFEGLHLLIAEDGENLRTRQTPIAFLADGQFWANNHAHIVTGKPDVADTRFLCYALAATDITGYLTGSAMPKLSQRAMNAIELTVPALAEQRRIADVLGSLDDKIEQNRRTGRKLEALARAVFKAWFVDFEPVKAKAAGATTFPGMPAAAFAVLPDRLTSSPLGPVPQGWEVQRLDSISTLRYGKSLPKTKRRSGTIPVYGSGGVDGTHRESLVKGPGIIVGRKGSVGTLYWEDDAFYPIDTTYYVEPTAGLGLHYLFALLQTFGLENMNTDAAVPGLNRENAYRLEAAVPPAAIADRFEEYAIMLRNMVSHFTAESSTLAVLRDYLLPRLLSGRVRFAKMPTTNTEYEQ